MKEQGSNERARPWKSAVTGMQRPPVLPQGYCFTAWQLETRTRAQELSPHNESRLHAVLNPQGAPGLGLKLIKPEDARLRQWEMLLAQEWGAHVEGATGLDLQLIEARGLAILKLKRLQVMCLETIIGIMKYFMVSQWKPVVNHLFREKYYSQKGKYHFKNWVIMLITLIFLSSQEASGPWVQVLNYFSS